MVTVQVLVLYGIIDVSEEHTDLILKYKDRGSVFLQNVSVRIREWTILKSKSKIISVYSQSHETHTHKTFVHEVPKLNLSKIVGFPPRHELPKIYLSQDIKSVSELYGQSKMYLYIYIYLFILYIFVYVFDRLTNRNTANS
jgi:hypothetical protein